MTNPKDEEMDFRTFRHSGITTLSSIPSIKDFKELSFSSFGYSPIIQEEQLKQMWATVKPISASDPMIDRWQYAPWLGGTFSTVEGKYTFNIYGGGLGTLITPNGEKGYILVDAKASD